MIASRIAFLFAAAAILAGCAIPVRADPAVEDRLVIRGEMFYPEHLALTPDCVAIVELRADDAGPSELVAEQRRRLDGRQVPIPFELSRGSFRTQEPRTPRLPRGDRVNAGPGARHGSRGDHGPDRGGGVGRLEAEAGGTDRLRHPVPLRRHIGHLRRAGHACTDDCQGRSLRPGSGGIGLRRPLRGTRRHGHPLLRARGIAPR